MNHRKVERRPECMLQMGFIGEGRGLVASKYRQ